MDLQAHSLPTDMPEASYFDREGFSDSCDVIENVLTQASAAPTELSSDTSLITLDEQQFALLTRQAENVGTEVAASSLSCSGALSVFLPGGLRLG